MDDHGQLASELRMLAQGIREEDVVLVGYGILDNAADTIDELLEACELIMRCDEKGFIDLKPPWHNQLRRAIQKARGV